MLKMLSIMSEKKIKEFIYLNNINKKKVFTQLDCHYLQTFLKQYDIHSDILELYE